MGIDRGLRFVMVIKNWDNIYKLLDYISELSIAIRDIAIINTDGVYVYRFSNQKTYEHFYTNTKDKQ
jgi:hypothetical protein